MKRCVGEHISPTREKGKGKGARRRAELDGAHSLGQVLKKGLERREREEGSDSDPSWLAERELRWAGVEGCLDDDGEHRAHLQFNKAAGAGFTTTQKQSS